MSPRGEPWAQKTAPRARQTSHRIQADGERVNDDVTRRDIEDPRAEPLNEEHHRPRGKRWLYLGLGWISLVLGAVGIFLPLLPTTPFLLLAAFCFARGSDESYRWLLSHPRFGPPIRHWRRHRAVSLRAKGLATLSIIAVVAVGLWLGPPTWVLALQGVVLASVALFVWTRPLPPR